MGGGELKLGDKELNWRLKIKLGERRIKDEIVEQRIKFENKGLNRRMKGIKS